MTWSEMSSSLSTINLFHDSYHSNSLTGDSGVDCPEILIENRVNSDDEHEILLKKYDTRKEILLKKMFYSLIFYSTEIPNESQTISYISTEKGLERALEQTSRFYTDLEHIASDLGTLTKRYSQSHQSIDALDWDLHDDDSNNNHSPKHIQRKQVRSNNKTKVRRRLNTNQIEYNESDSEKRLFDYSSSPLRRSMKKRNVYFFMLFDLEHSSVYFDSTENTSDEENFGDETLQINS